ncbi:MAG: peptidase M48 Ste24p [Candidatus Electrothrix sp. AR3]|nr:peptidase M48 Ste24p [Candidatus Electrothrix sp. AR3]
MYNNLIYFLVVIFILSTATASEIPTLSPWQSFPLFIGVLFVFYRIAGKQYQIAFQQRSSAAYFSVEKKLSILAVILFVSSVFVFDFKYYLAPLSVGGFLPILENLGGILLFFLFFSIIWVQAHSVYQILFNSKCSLGHFVYSNIRTNLSILFPWLILSLIFDLLHGLPLPKMQEFLQSTWGDLFLFFFLILLLALLFPPMIRRLWDCTPMQPGLQRLEIEALFHQQNFSSEILCWPLFEGKALTAAVMGIVPRLRYILLTPALLAALEKDELESVLAHEIGHVKHYHLLLYMLLLFSFSLLTGALSESLIFCFFRCDGLAWLRSQLQLPAETLLVYFVSLALFIFMLFYFRFLFGYFIRNFERQADLYVFQAQENSFSLIRSFEKISAMSGNIRNKKNWHHFGIGERIDFLLQCEKDREHIRQHNHKVYTSLVVYFILTGIVTWFLYQQDTATLISNQQKYYAQRATQYSSASTASRSVSKKRAGKKSIGDR